MHKNKEALVETEILWTRIVVLLVLFIGIGVGIVGVKQFTSTQSKAGVPQVLPSPLVEVSVPTPLVDSKKPYVRLVTTKEQFSFTETVPVEVYLNTDNQAASELTLIMTYNPEILEFDPAATAIAPIFQTGKLDTQKKGTIILTLFTTSAVGQPIAVAQETKVAELRFKTLVTEGEAPIDLKFDPVNKASSYLLAYDAQKGPDAKNILQAVHGLSFNISP